MTPAGLAPEAVRRARFATVALPLMKPLYNAALRLTRDGHAAEDVVQETYLRAYRTFEGFAEGTNAKAWLFTILHSVFVNRYHRERREPESLPPDDIEAAFARAAATNGPAPAERSLTGQEARAALAQLSQDFRSAIELVDLQDLSYEEAAVALDCKVGTLKSRLFRARKLLFAGLERYAKELGYPTQPGRTE